MINKMLRCGFKLPHMSKSPVAYKEPKALKPEMRGPINFDHDDSDPVFKPQPDDKVPSFQDTFTNSSGGGNSDDEELNKFLEGIHEVDNPEYTDPDNPEYEAPRSTEHDFFIKNRSKESDSIAKVFMNLDKDARKLRGERNFKAAGEKQNEINDLLKYIKKQNQNRIQE